MSFTVKEKPTTPRPEPSKPQGSCLFVFEFRFAGKCFAGYAKVVAKSEAEALSTLEKEYPSEKPFKFDTKILFSAPMVVDFNDGDY